MLQRRQPAQGSHQAASLVPTAAPSAMSDLQMRRHHKQRRCSATKRAQRRQRRHQRNRVGRRRGLGLWCDLDHTGYRAGAGIFAAFHVCG